MQDFKRDSRCKKAMKGVDAYAVPIQMSYKQNTTFPTVFGGVASIIHFLLTAAFFGYAVYQLTEVDWAIQTYGISNQQDDGTRPDYSVSQTDIIVGFRLNNPNETQWELLKYFGPYFRQRKERTVTKSWNTVNCTEFYTQEQIFQNTGIDYSGFQCINMTESEHLQLGGPQNNASFFELVFGACDQVQNITGSTDCYKESDSLSIMDKTQVELIIVNKIPNGNVYVNNVNRTYSTSQTSLSMIREVSSLYKVQLIPIQATFAYNWFYSTFQSVMRNYFRITYMDPCNAINPRDNTELMRFSFEIGNLLEVQNWTCNSLFDSILAFAALNALLMATFGSVVATYSNFNLNRNLIKNLYTEISSEAKAEIAETQNSINDDASEALIKEEQDKLLVLRTLNRLPFSYLVRTAWLDWIKTSVFFCFCGKCCFRSSFKKQKFRFAQEKLFEEMDIVQMMKMLRFIRYMANGILKPHHWLMISNFDKYCITDAKVEQQHESEGTSSSSENDDQPDNSDAPNSWFQSEGPDLKWLTYYTKLENQKKIQKRILTQKMSAGDRQKLIEWACNVKNLVSFNIYKKHFNPHLTNQSNRMDLVALEQLLGSDQIDQPLIEHFLQELKIEQKKIEKDVLAFKESKEGSELISKIRHGKTKREQEDQNLGQDKDDDEQK